MPVVKSGRCCAELTSPHLHERKDPKRTPRAYFVYVAECSGGRLYTGYTVDIEKRMMAHKSGKGAKFTRAFKLKKIVYTEIFNSKSNAMKREAEIKSWPRQKKEQLWKA